MSKSRIQKRLEDLERGASKRGQKKLYLEEETVDRERLLLPYGDGTIYTVIARDKLGTTQNLNQALQEVRRVLRKGGKVAGQVWTRQGRDYVRGRFFFARKEYSAAIRKGFHVLASTAVMHHKPDKLLIQFLLEKR